MDRRKSIGGAVSNPAPESISSGLPARNLLVGLGFLMIGGLPAQAQVSIKDRSVAFHGFLAQGCVTSSLNNILTLASKGGALDSADGAINGSTPISNWLRVGGQRYSRHIGNLVHGGRTLAWAVPGYHYRNCPGVRGGQVKTALGLCHDGQEIWSLHTWALLPQSLRWGSLS